MKKNLLLLLTFLTTISCSKEEHKSKVEKKNKAPLEKLIDGHKRFLEEKPIHPHQNKKSILENQNGQHPFAVILTCSDSRLTPEILFDQGIGDLFVIRNAGNLISDIDMGSIEYAVEYLDTKLIVVLGHTECGAIKAYDEITMEIKRMYVSQEMRGHGIAHKILSALEVWAHDLGFTRCILETGDDMLPAVSLYKKCGYIKIPNYGQYIDVTDSVCFQKYI